MKPSRLFLWLAFVALVCGCKKDKTYSLDPARDHITADLLFNDMLHMIDAESRITDGIKSVDYPCLDITDVDTVADPKFLLLSYVDPECYGKFAWGREGAVFLSYSDKYSEPGCQVIASIQEFSIEGWTINGVITMEYNGLNTDEQPYWSVLANDLEFRSPSGTQVSRWSTNQVRQMTGGVDTDYTIDDEFKITGTASGTDRDGMTYSLSYGGGFLDKTVCPIPSNGELTLKVEGEPDRKLSYGNGACDELVRIEVEDQSELFTFP